MLAAPSRDWNVFKQIFADHWEPFQRAHPRYQTAYYDGLVAKMLACGTPEQMGYVEYRCLQCGQGTHRVAMSCKSSWLLLDSGVVDVIMSYNAICTSRIILEGLVFQEPYKRVEPSKRPCEHKPLESNKSPGINSAGCPGPFCRV